MARIGPVGIAVLPVPRRGLADVGGFVVRGGADLIVSDKDEPRNDDDRERKGEAALGPVGRHGERIHGCSTSRLTGCLLCVNNFSNFTRDVFCLRLRRLNRHAPSRDSGGRYRNSCEMYFQ